MSRGQKFRFQVKGHNVVKIRAENKDYISKCFSLQGISLHNHNCFVRHILQCNAKSLPHCSDYNTRFSDLLPQLISTVTTGFNQTKHSKPLKVLKGIQTDMQHYPQSETVSHQNILDKYWKRWQIINQQPSFLWRLSMKWQKINLTSGLFFFFCHSFSCLFVFNLSTVLCYCLLSTDGSSAFINSPVHSISNSNLIQ